MFDAHFCEPDALVDTPFLEHFLHVCLSLILWGRVALSRLAGLGQDDYLVDVFLSFYQILVCTLYSVNRVVDLILGLFVVG